MYAKLLATCQSVMNHPPQLSPCLTFRAFMFQEGQGHQGHIKKTQKRFAPSEESLVKQLNGLKKMAA
jgi:hypothetical protein